MSKVFRGLIIVVALALISAVCFLCLASAQEPSSAVAATFQISGTVRNGKILLPGVTVTAANTLTGKKYSVVSATNGAFQFTELPRGRYVEIPEAEHEILMENDSIRAKFWSEFDRFVGDFSDVTKPRP